MSREETKAGLPTEVQFAAFQALRKGKFKEAIQILKLDRPLPDVTDDVWRKASIGRLRLIFSADPLDARALNLRARSFYAALGCIFDLYGQSVARRFLRCSLDEARPHLRNARLYWIFGVSAYKLHSIVAAGCEKVKCLTPPEACEICRADRDREIIIGAAPVLPHPGCTCENGCACHLIAVIPGT